MNTDINGAVGIFHFVNTCQDRQQAMRGHRRNIGALPCVGTCDATIKFFVQSGIDRLALFAECLCEVRMVLGPEPAPDPSCPCSTIRAKRPTTDGTLSTVPSIGTSRNNESCRCKDTFFSNVLDICFFGVVLIFILALSIIICRCFGLNNCLATFTCDISAFRLIFNGALIVLRRFASILTKSPPKPFQHFIKGFKLVSILTSRCC